MAEADSVKGYTGPINPKEPEKERVAHPDEFKKILKVDESEESQKRRQRQLKKEESEGDDEDISTQPPPPSVESTFSEHMSDKKKLDGLYDTQAPSTQGPTKAPTSAPLLPSMDETPPSEDVDINEESSYVPPETASPLPQSPSMQEEASTPQEENVPSPANAQPQKPSTSSPQTAQPQQPPSKAKKVTDTSLLKDQPLKGALKKKTTTTKKALTKNKSTTKTSSTQTSKSPDTDKVEPEKSQTVNTNNTTQTTTPKEDATQKKDNSNQTATSTSALMQDVPQSTQIEPTLAAPPTNLPSYTQLSTPVYELFEKMVGHITIVNEKGIDSKTEVTLSMSGSVFDHSKIILDKKGSSFNIQFQGSDKANKLFGKNIQDLERCLQENQPNFSYNVLKPVLLPSLRATRKKKATPKAATKVRKKP